VENREIIDKFDKTRQQLKEEKKEKQLERALYNWLNRTEDVETAICKLLDGKISKKDLIKVNSDIKQKFKYLENKIKEY
jgi:hypothetical protein